MVLAGVLPIAVVLGGLLSLVVMVVGGREHPYGFSRPVVVLTAAGALWSLPIGVGFYVHSPAVHAWLRGIAWIGAIAAPLGLLAVAVRFAGIEVSNPRWGLIVGSVPAITSGLLLTVPFHGALWRSLEVRTVDGLARAEIVYGPWITIHRFWTFGVVAAAAILVVWRAVDGSPAVRAQATAITLVGGAPFALQLASVAGYRLSPGVDQAALLVGATSAFVGMAVLVGNPIAFRPITRERLVEELRDGIVVLDAAGRIREANPVARSILRAHGIAHETPERLPEELRTSGEQLEVVLDGESRKFNCVVHEIGDVIGQAAGGLVYYYDVTEVARREQRISVLHRVLRHNIRNEMTILLGHLDYVAGTIDPALDEDVAAVERSAERIMGFAEQARLIERSLKEGKQDTRVEMDACVRQAVDTVRHRHEGTDVSLTIDSADAPHAVSAVDRELLLGAVEELIDNAVVHGAGTVDVAVHRDGSWITVGIRDEGPGIPEAEIEALESPAETSLEHATGLGLWVARWAAELSGGALRFDRDAGTNVVRLQLPVNPADVDDGAR